MGWQYFCAIYYRELHTWCHFVLCNLFIFTLEAFMCAAFPFGDNKVYHIAQWVKSETNSQDTLHMF